jgi:hypothetical protein
MSIQIGARLGAYEVRSFIGAGGMGEVYKARHTSLNRDVALKILPELSASDPDRLARFRREAQVLASLNHPNIAAIYGFEESNGVQALVLELVEGPTLADRISQRPIPMDEAFSAVGDDGRQLYLRALDQAQAQPLEDTEGAVNPFFSPDGRWVGVWANGQMKKISISGGPAIPLTETAEPLGASWGSNDMLVYGKRRRH